MESFNFVYDTIPKTKSFKFPFLNCFNEFSISFFFFSSPLLFLFFSPRVEDKVNDLRWRQIQYGSGFKNTRRWKISFLENILAFWLFSFLHKNVSLYLDKYLNVNLFFVKEKRLLEKLISPVLKNRFSYFRAHVYLNSPRFSSPGRKVKGKPKSLVCLDSYKL